MFSPQSVTPPIQTNPKTQLDLTQFQIIKEEKKTSAFPLESIGGGKLGNLAGNWLIYYEQNITKLQSNPSHSTTTSAIQALNIKTNEKKTLANASYTYTTNINGTQLTGSIHFFGDWVALPYFNYANSENNYSLQIINAQTGEKRDLATAAEKYTNLSVQPLNETWGAVYAYKESNSIITVMLFNAQTGVIKTLSANNKICSLNYRDSLHPTVICYQDDKGLHFFDYEQWKELDSLPENTEVVQTITKPKPKDYLNEIANLKNKPEVEEIIATNLGLGDVLVETLVMNVLPHQKALKCLDLRGNKLTNESAKLLYMAIQKYPQLLEIQLDNNAISPDWQQAIKERLKRNQPKPPVVVIPPIVSNVQIPPEYLCPLTMKIMLDPVMASDGETYEREEIEKWLENNNTSPSTLNPLLNKTLISNNGIKKGIKGFLDKNTDLRKSDKFYLSKRLIAQCIEAIKTGDCQTLIQVLDQDIRLLTMSLENNNNLLLLACQQNNPVILKTVINRLLQENCWKQAVEACKSEEEEYHEHALLELTAIHMDLEGVKLLIQAFGWSLIDLEEELDTAIAQEDMLLIGILVKLGAPLHHYDEHGYTPLHKAAVCHIGPEAIDLVKLLVELGADTKAISIGDKSKYRPSEMAQLLGKPELALAIENAKQKRKLAGVMQPLLMSLQQQSEQISLLQEENNLLRQRLAAIASEMPPVSGTDDALSKHLTQSFSQFGQNLAGPKTQATSNSTSVPQIPNITTSSSFYQPAPKAVVANDTYNSAEVEKLLNNIKQDHKDVEVSSALIDADKNIQLFANAITDFMKKRSAAIKAQNESAKRVIIPLCIDNHFVTVCIAYPNKVLVETPSITYIDPRGDAISPAILKELEQRFPNAKVVKSYGNAQTTDNNNTPWMVETVKSVLANNSPLMPAFDIETAKQEHKKILAGQTATATP